MDDDMMDVSEYMSGMNLQTVNITNKAIILYNNQQLIELTEEMKVMYHQLKKYERWNLNPNLYFLDYTNKNILIEVLTNDSTFNTIDHLSYKSRLGKILEDTDFIKIHVPENRFNEFVALIPYWSKLIVEAL